MSRLSEQRKLRLLQAGARVPRAVWVPLGQLASVVLAMTRPRPLRQWERNFTVATGRVPGFPERRRAQWSWFRNTIGSLQLGRWSHDRIQRTVVIAPDDLARVRELLHSRGAVIAAPHMGSWDLAGAFAGINDLPLTSVAERLPAGQYEYFSSLRVGLGMRIYPYDMPHLIARLAEDVRQGQLVCLVADRDFGRRGPAVKWPTPDGPIDMTLPAGPAAVAHKTGAALIGIACRFDGPRMYVHVGAEIVAREDADPIADMSQQLAEYFAEQVQSHPTDWHMMQRFFPGEAV